MKLLVDMNLTPRWTEFLAQDGWESIHWSSVGDIRAKDSHITDWARSHGCWILTNDLDFPQILAHTRAAGPSIVLLRGEPLTPETRGDEVRRVLHACFEQLAVGAIVSVDWGERLRIRLLPLL